jgi:hypothetical protein
MSIETVFVKVIVKPKNSVIKSKICDRYFLNIRTNKLEIGKKFYNKNKCSWFEPLDDDFFLLLDDTMYIEFMDDVSHIKDNYLSTCELMNEDYTHSGIKSDYIKVWEVVSKDFNKFLEDRKEIKKSLPYILNISVYSSYNSWDGDGDVYLNITDVIRFKGGKIEVNKLENIENNEYIN